MSGADRLNGWRKGRTVELRLPSGLAVMVRRVRLVDLAARGSVPAPLVGVVNEALKGEKFNAASVDDFAEYGKVVDLVVLAAVVDPPVVEGAGDEEHLGLDELGLDDKTEIFNWAHSEGERLAGFRAEPAGDVDVGADGGGVLPEAECVDEGAG